MLAKRQYWTFGSYEYDEYPRMGDESSLEPDSDDAEQ